MKTAWWTKTWNPMTGCTPVSEGCDHCWARRWARERCSKLGPAYSEFKPTFHLDRIQDPIHWRKPQRVAVSLMGDMFHTSHPWSLISRILDVAAACPQHQFFFLTKRSYNLFRYSVDWRDDRFVDPMTIPGGYFGVSVENQMAADVRIPMVMRAEVPNRFLSIEPLLSPVKLAPYLAVPQRKEYGDPRPLCIGPSLDWVVVGAETGHDARPCDPDWIRSIRGECRDHKIPLYVKSLGDRKEIPLDLRIRELPDFRGENP